MSRIVLPGEPLRDDPTALRPWRDADVPGLVRVCRDEAVVRWTRVPPNYTEADARNYLLQRHDAILAGTAAPFAIVSAGPPYEELLGSISLIRFDWQHRRAEVGYFLGRDARGRGHATRAVGLICDWAFSSLGLERIELLAATENLPSQRVAERCGFEREAVLRSFMRARGGQLDMIGFGLLAARTA